ncbi:shikimate O-hydroxycinnamoyltransferase [Salvia divinorum]|uniref:Shikimate O-hydroxycinnamoyltransferase n=1 Tax=Salvia divinorum TaxID=28513 RepID=A0ABD1HRV7_SALDI
MRANVVRRKLIKPCTPTPKNLKNYKISCIDELAPSTNIGVLLFYPPKPGRIIQKLEESLQKILPQFYVLAGRYIKTNHSINCGDEGVEFVEAEAADDELPDIVGTSEQLNDLLPRRSYQMDGELDPLLSVQITDLKCGGLVIGVSVSHRIFDTCSLATFIAAWSNASSSSAENISTVIPSFDESTALFPGRHWSKVECSRMEGHGIVCRRFCFNKEAIDRLRSKLGPEDGKLKVSKVLVVSAVIAKALIGRSRDYYISHAVNMRGRTIPPMQKHACGNLVLQALSSCVAEVEMGTQELVNLMDEAIGKAISKCGQLSLGGATLKPVANALPEASTTAVWFSDWSKFGFCDIDFGQGKPVWVGIAPMHAQDTTILMGNRDGDGIEAWVHLTKDDMKLFET